MSAFEWRFRPAPPPDLPDNIFLMEGRVAERTDTALFTDGAARLAGLAGVAFGWSPDAFWRATPAELAVLVRAATGDDAALAPPDAMTITRLREAFPDG